MKVKVLFCLLLVFANLAYANTKLSVLTEDWRPFNYQEGNAIVGSSTAYVKRLLAHTNLDYQIEIREWSEAYAILKSEPNTLLYSTFKTPKRAPLFHWICPINQPVYSSVYALNDRSDINADNFKALKNYSIGITAETYPFHLFKGLGFIEGQHLQVTKNNSSNMGMLLRRRVDLIVESDIAIAEMIKMHKVDPHMLKKLMTIEDPEHPEICLAINKETDSDTIEKLQHAHKQLQLTTKI